MANGARRRVASGEQRAGKDGEWRIANGEWKEQQIANREWRMVKDGE
jgi:hypothetical protein